MKKSFKIVIILTVCVVVVTLLSVLGYFIYVKSTYLSKEEVKEIVIRDTNLNRSDIVFEKVDLELDRDLKKYDVEFYYNRVWYTYEIEAKTGTIIYSNYVSADSSNPSNGEVSSDSNTGSDTNQSTSPSTNPSTNNYISAEDAKTIALNDSKFSANEVIFTDVEFDIKNGKAVYEVDFYNNNLEYDYIIDAVNKNIISKTKEPRD